MQELIDFVESLKESQNIKPEIIKKANSLLSKEKQQIIEAFEIDTILGAEKYFKKKYF